MNEAKNCQWRVARRPKGNVVNEDFEYRENMYGKENKLEIPISAINEVVNENSLTIVAVTANQIFLKKD